MVDYTSDDPQAEIASQGWQKTADIAGPIIDQNIQDQYHSAVAASQGDPQAQLDVAQNALGNAMGSLKNIKTHKFKIETDMERGNIELVDPKNDNNVASGQSLGSEYDHYLGDEDTSHNLPFKNAATLDSLTVDPKMQGQGIGSSLLQQYIKHSKDLGHDAIILNASPMGAGVGSVKDSSRLDDLIRFYKAHGFKEYGPKEESNQMMIRSLDKKKKFAEGGDVDPSAMSPLIMDDSILAHQSAPTQTPDIPLMPTSAPPVNVLNPEGTLVSLPADQVEEALAAGYTQPSNDEVKHYFKQQQYGSAEQQAKTIAEGAAKGIAGPLATLAETKLLGVKPEDILGREEVNPGEHWLSEVGGLLAGSATGFGEGALLAKAGEAAAAGVGLGTATHAAALAQPLGTGAKIGSQALKGMIEGGLFQTGDEASRAIMEDPNQSVETALANIKLGGLLGGGLGATIGSVSPLWHAIEGPKLGQVLESLQKRLGGVEGAEIPDAIDTLIHNSGMDIKPEVKASLKQDPGNQLLFQGLQESTTKAGTQMQTALKEFKGDISKSILNSLGKTPESIEKIGDVSEYEVGERIKKAITSSVEDTIKPLSKKFDEIKTLYSKEALPPMAIDGVADDLGNLASKEGYNLSPSSAQSHLVQQTLKELPNLNTLEDLRKYQSIIGDKTFGNPELRRVGGQVKAILRNAEDDVIQKAAGRIDPTAIDEHALARQGYREAMTSLDQLNDRLHVGRYNGPDSFLQALKEMAPEDVLRRLNPKSDAGLIVDLAEKYPYAATEVRDYHLNQLLEKAKSKAGPGEAINSSSFMKSLDGLSPEMRQFLVPEEAAQKIGTYQQLLEALPERLNPSGTAKTLDHIWSHVPASAAAFTSMLFGHNPITGYLIGQLGKYVARDAPDSIKLALLKFLGSGSQVQAKSFKATVDFLHQTMKGNTAITNGIKDVFKTAGSVLPEPALQKKPEALQKGRIKLDDMIKALSEKPEVGMQKLTEVGGDLGHYMPEHSAALAQSTTQAVQYLNSLRPQMGKNAPFDSNIKANPFQQAKYDKALDIAQQPLLVLDKIKRGSITPEEVVALKSMYPALHTKLSNRLIDQAIQHTSKNQAIPYSTRLGISLFTGTPMDSTMTPESIRSMQPFLQQQQAMQEGAKKGGVKSAPALQKMSSMYETPAQARAKRGNKE